MIWTKDKIQFLKKNIDTKTNPEFAILFNVTRNSIAHILNRLKIKRKNITCSKEITYVINGKCWECNSHQIVKGYPVKKYKKKQCLMARFVYEQYYKTKIPEGYCIRHTCDNKLCINPLHLIIGTRLDNARDAVERNKYKKGSQIKLAKLNEQQVVEIKNKITQGITCIQIAKEYNMGQNAIYNIKYSKTWKHVK